MGGGGFPVRLRLSTIHGPLTGIAFQLLDRSRRWFSSSGRHGSFLLSFKIYKRKEPADCSVDSARCSASKIGAPAPHVWLLKPSEKFSQPYGVAIEFIDDLKPVDKDHLTEQMKKDIYAQFALNSLIDTDDTLQLSAAGGRIYSFDFSESFYVSDTLMLRAFLFSEDAGIALAQNKLSAFCGYQAQFSLDFTIFAEQLGLDPTEMNAEALFVAKKLLEISEDEIRALSDELCEMYPPGYAVYYEECIHAIQEKMKRV